MNWILGCQYNGDAGCTVGNHNFRGTVTKTINGHNCQKWTMQTPHQHNNTPLKRPNYGLGDHNFCRNPNGHHTIWCYTTNPKKRWEECNLPENPFIMVNGE